MEIIEDRYGRGSTLITSQLPVEAWHEVIGEPTLSRCLLFGTLGMSYTSTKPIDLFVR